MPSEVPIGSVLPYAGDTPPHGWFLCDGSELQINSYIDLFNVIGNKFGGDGITTFRLPSNFGSVAGLSFILIKLVDFKNSLISTNYIIKY